MITDENVQKILTELEELVTESRKFCIDNHNYVSIAAEYTYGLGILRAIELINERNE